MTMALPNRNLFTGDCTYLFQSNQYNPGDGPYSARVFHDHIAHLARHGIDTYLCNPQAQGNWWPSRRMPTVFDGYRKGDREFCRGHLVCEGGPSALENPAWVEASLDKHVRLLNHYLELQEAGIDWVAECARACRQHGLAPWLTIRMNDMHGCENPASYFNAPVFRDPANRLTGRHIEGTRTYFAGLNYLRPAVREFMMGTIRELVEDYDFEGIELDWLRNPICCEPNATQAQIDQITAFHADVRSLTQAKAKQTGRPYAMGLRVPPTFDLLRSIGIDVPAMAQAELLDFVSPSNFWQTTWDLPYDTYRAKLGSAITIYGVIECAANWVPFLDAHTGLQSFRHQPFSPELLRGNAAGKLALGVDGLEYFNFFCADQHSSSLRADYGALADLPILKKLRGQSKLYTLSSIFGDCWLPPFEQSEQIPVVLEQGWRRQFHLSMCAEPPNAGTLVVQVVVEKKDDLPVLSVRFNECWPSTDGEATNCLLFPIGNLPLPIDTPSQIKSTYGFNDRNPIGPLTHLAPGHQAMNYRFPVTAIREGWNEIEIFAPGWASGTARERLEQAVCVVNLDLAVIPNSPT
jgi:hypothetical protein